MAEAELRSRAKPLAPWITYAAWRTITVKALEMDPVRRLPLPLVMLVLVGPSVSGIAEKPTWAKKARVFPSECREKRDFKSCKPVRIPSPDGSSVVEVLYRDESNMRVAFLRVSTRGGSTREIDLPWGFQDIDLLWSPDSKAFFVNGGNGGYWGFWVFVFRLDDPGLEPFDVTHEARRDMLESFPPCIASGIGRATCKYIETDSQYPNMSRIDWAGDSSAIVVMAEVPCSGGFGGIMCQVAGYELGVPTGRILKRVDAQQFKARWHRSMAFKLTIPDPPEYEPSK